MKLIKKIWEAFVSIATTLEFVFYFPLGIFIILAFNTIWALPILAIWIGVIMANVDES